MKKTDSHKSAKPGYLFLWILLTLLIFFGGVITFLYFNVEHIINNNLSEYVYEKTDSTYHFQFEDLKIDFIKKDISAANIILQPAPNVPTDSLKANYYFKTHFLKISDIKLWPLLRDRRLVASSLNIEKPEFEFGKDQKVDLNFLSKFQLKKGEELKIPILAEIFFDTLSILNAQLNIDTLFTTPQELPQINLVANHFKLGGKKFTDTPYPFDVSDLSLTVENLNKKLPDNLHQISVKEIQLSLLHSAIIARNASLKPVYDTINSVENQFRIEVPEIKLEVKNISKIEDFDTLSIQSVEFIDPSIQVKFGAKIKKGTPPNEINFYDLTGNTIKWIKINRFSFKNADVVFKPSNNDEVAQHFENLFVNFFDFLIDSTSYKAHDRMLSAKNMSFDLNRFTLNHSDKVHQLVINNLKGDSRTQEITTGPLLFEPIDENAKNINTIIHINSKGIGCSGINFLQFYHYQILPMTELTISYPKIQIDFERKRTIRKNEKDKSIILDKISDYLTGVYVDTTKITNGAISYNYSTLDKEEGFFRTNFNFELVNLSVDSTTFEQSDKIFFADNFEVNFEDLNLQLADETHRLITKQIYLSSTDKSAQINDLRILPINEIAVNDSSNFQNKLEFFDIHFPNIKLSGANLHRAFFDKMLFINSIHIANPTLNIEKFGEWKTDNIAKTPYQNALYAMVSDFLFSVNIRHLNMENGVLNMAQHKQNQPDFNLSNQFSIKMTNFELDANSSEKPNKLFFSDDIDLVLKDHSFTLADGVHKVDADEIGILSSEKRIYITNAKLYPDILSKKFQELPVSVFANIPDMQITSADIFGLFNKGNFPVNNVIINKPEIKLLFQKDSKEAEVEKDQKAIFIMNDLNSVTANRIKINNGKLELAQYSNFKSTTLVNSTVNFELDGFNINHREGKFETNYADFRVDIKNLTYNLPDQTHSFTIEQANYQLNSQVLSLKNVSIKPMNSALLNNKDLFIDVNIPDIQITQFNFKDYLKTDDIKIAELAVERPHVTITDKRIEKKNKFSPYELDLYPLLKAYAKTLIVSNITITNGGIDINNNRPVHLNYIGITAQNFRINKENTQRNKLLNTDFIELNMNNIAGKTKGNYYEYKINQLRVNTEGDFISKGISIQPVYSEQEFAKRKVYQADYFNIDNANLSGTGLDIRELIEHQNIFTDVINANFDNVKIHRDKSYPLTPNFKAKLPQEALRDLKQGIMIKSAALSVNRFQFTEQEKNAYQNSMVFVTNATAELYNVTNVREKLALNPTLDAKIHGTLYGIGDALVELKLNVPSFGNEFTCNATCGTMPLSALNPIAEPGLKLSIKEGINQKMEVYFEANEDSAVGNIKFAYNDLKISVLNARDGELKEGKFISFLVNSIALKTDNPKPGRILLPAKFTNHRDKQRSVVGYCWRSIYSGIKATMGLKEK